MKTEQRFAKVEYQYVTRTKRWAVHLQHATKPGGMASWDERGTHATEAAAFAASRGLSEQYGGIPIAKGKRR